MAIKVQTLDNYYVDNYGEDAATIASVVSLAAHGELFDRDPSDEALVESYFLRVPNSTLIVNRVDTNDEYGLSKSFTVLDGEEPLLQLDSGRVAFNHLSLSQAEALQAGQRVVASPLLVSESFFQADVAQAMTRDGEAQARAILSQGDAITPAIVTELNDLMAAEEAIRSEDQSSRGLTGHVSYARFTEYELNQNLSIDTIARQLSAQSPVVEVQSIQEPVTQSVYDRPQFELERMETLAMTLLQAGETLVSPAKLAADGRPLLPPMQLSLSDQVSQGQPLIQRVYEETDYSPGQRSLHSSAVLHDGVLQAMQDGTLETSDRQLVRVPDLLTWEQLQAPALNPVEGLGYMVSVDAERVYRTQWSAASDLPLPSVSEAIAVIPGAEAGIPNLKSLLDGQRVLLDQAQQSPLALPLLPSLRELATELRDGGQDVSLYLETTAPDVQPLHGGETLAFSNPYTVSYTAEAERVAVFRPGSDAAVIVVEPDSYYVDGLSPSDAAFLQKELPFVVNERQTAKEREPVSAASKPTDLDYERLQAAVRAASNEELYAMDEGVRHSFHTLEDVQTLANLGKAGPVFYFEAGGDLPDVAVQVFTYEVPNSTLTVSRLTKEQEPDTLLVKDGQITVFKLDLAEPNASVNDLTYAYASALQTAALAQLEVGSPQVETSIDQERSQAVAQKPPVVGYESGSTKPHLRGKANVMVAVETPVKAQTEIDLRDLMSQKTLGIMETGEVPRQRMEVDGKPQLVDRTPAEGLTMVAKAAYGAQNFCQENNLPHTPATEVIATAADRLSLNGAAVTGVLNSIDKAKCRPSMEVATQSQSGVWARIEAKYPEYAGKVPEALKTERAAAQAAVEPAKEAVAEATTRQVKAPVLKQSALEQQQPSQFEMAIVVAAYRLQEAGVDRWGHDNEKSTLIFNRSKEGNISVINKADNVVIATRNAVTSAVIPGVLPPGQDYSQAFKAVVEKQTEKYAVKTAATPKAKVAADDGR